jgi:hypothetical protein
VFGPTFFVVRNFPKLEIISFFKKYKKVDQTDKIWVCDPENLISASGVKNETIPDTQHWGKSQNVKFFTFYLTP